MIYCHDCRFRIVSNLRSGASYCAYYNSPNETILGCESGESKIITNADRIRNMTDEELAETITEDWCSILCPGGSFFCDGECLNKMIEWLKQECADG